MMSFRHVWALGIALFLCAQVAWATTGQEVDGNGSFSGDVTAGQNLIVTGGNIKSSPSTTALTLSGGDVSAAGNVGIGTTSPAVRLHVGASNSNVNSGFKTYTNGNALMDGGVSCSSIGSSYTIGRGNFGYDYTRLAAYIWAIGGKDIVFDTNNSGSLGAAGAEKMRITHDGKVGIGTASPQASLDVYGNIQVSGELAICGDLIRSNGGAPAIYLHGNNIEIPGMLELDPTNPMSYISGKGLVFAKTHDGVTDVFAWGDYGTAQQLTSHFDPRCVKPDAMTSFGDGEVVLPFSFHHQNLFMGKGSVVDMAKAFSYLEKKMQTELGNEAGRLVFNYDLPSSETLSVTQRQVDFIAARLAAAPWVKVTQGADSAIPPESVEEYAEMEEQEQTRTIEETRPDFETMRVVTVTREEVVRVMVPTGRTLKRFKPGWEFRNGDLYRAPTLNDLDVGAILQTLPPLPTWITQRISAGQQANLGVDDLIKQLKQTMQAMAAKSGIKQTAAAK